MKGVVFNLLEAVIIQHHGEDLWDDLLDASDLRGAYTSLGSYPDEDMLKLVEQAALRLDLPVSEVLCWFGRQAMPILAERYPAFFEGHSCTRPFVLSVNSIIHPDVRKLYPGADVPVFDFSETDDGALLMGYRSARKLCALAQGFITGAADHFSESVAFEHQECMHHGDEKCLIRISFGPAKAH